MGSERLGWYRGTSLSVCPFCDDWRIRPPWQCEGGGYRVTCAKCNAEGPHAWTKVDAVRVWNERVKEVRRGE